MSSSNNQPEYAKLTYPELLERMNAPSSNDIAVQNQLVREIQKEFSEEEVENIIEHLFNAIPPVKLSVPIWFKKEKNLYEVAKLLHFDVATYDAVKDIATKAKNMDEGIEQITRVLNSTKNIEHAINSTSYLLQREERNNTISPYNKNIIDSSLVRACEEFKSYINDNE